LGWNCVESNYQTKYYFVLGLEFWDLVEIKQQNYLNFIFYKNIGWVGIKLIANYSKENLDWVWVHIFKSKYLT
jgi:hypothetical protein